MNFAKLHEICVRADAKGKNESSDAFLSSCRCFSKSAAVRCNQFNLRHLHLRVNNRHQNQIFQWTPLWWVPGEDLMKISAIWLQGGGRLLPSIDNWAGAGGIRFSSSWSEIPKETAYEFQLKCFTFLLPDDSMWEGIHYQCRANSKCRIIIWG